VVSGSHFKTVVFGSVGIDGTQFFRQYDTFDGPSFLDFLRKLHRRFGRLYLFMDKARQHHHTKIVTDYLRENRKTLRVRWIPTASPEFNAMEVLEAGREGPLRAARLPYKAGGAEEVPCGILPDEEVQPRHAKLPADDEVLLMKLCRAG
jgi:hypothetical protein